MADNGSNVNTVYVPQGKVCWGDLNKHTFGIISVLKDHKQTYSILLQFVTVKSAQLSHYIFIVRLVLRCEDFGFPY